MAFIKMALYPIQRVEIVVLLYENGVHWKMVTQNEVMSIMIHKSTFTRILGRFQRNGLVDDQRARKLYL